MKKTAHREGEPLARLSSDNIAQQKIPDTANSRKRPPPELLRRSRAMWRCADLRKLAYLRHGALGMSHKAFARLIAETLGAAPIGATLVGGKWKTWPGLSMLSLKDELRRCRLGTLTDDERWLSALTDAELEAIVAKPGRWRSAEKLGEILKLTAAERTALKITTIEAVDEPKAARKKRVARGRRDRHRDAYRAKHGSVTRAEYEGQSNERLKPWEAESMSKRTWYRRRREQQLAAEVVNEAVANTAAPVANGTSPERTHLRSKYTGTVRDLCPMATGGALANGSRLGEDKVRRRQPRPSAISKRTEPKAVAVAETTTAAEGRVAPCRGALRTCDTDSPQQWALDRPKKPPARSLPRLLRLRRAA